MLKIEIGSKYKAEDVKLANTYLKRLKGFMFIDKPDCEVLIITPCSSIHTYFMKFNIDVLFVDRDNVVIDKFINVPRSKLISPKKKARYVIEAAANTFLGIEENQKINLYDEKNKKHPKNE